MSDDLAATEAEIARLTAEIERIKSTGKLRQCKATNRAGERCQKPPLVGQTICAMHGGKAPAVLAAAKRRLLEAAEPVVVGLLEIFEDKAHTEARDRIRAGFGILDRAGLTPETNVQALGVAAGGNVLLYIPQNGRPAGDATEDDAEDIDL
jgi:hypothetical protein